MSRPHVTALLLLSTALVVFGLSLLVRRLGPSLDELDTSPWAATLSYVATSYGVVVGFSIIFLFGEFSDARQAVGDEATSIGTAFDEAALFPESGPGIQHALICYSRAVPEYDWPALQRGTSASQVDDAYRDLILALGEDDQPASGALHAATATNLVSQVGSISTARETRLVAAETQVPFLLWALLYGGGVLVVVLIFIVTVGARPPAQAILVALSAVFTAVMLLIVVALSAPFDQGGGRVTPELIEETTATMVGSAPSFALEPCPFPTRDE